jgi:hypothetical protein
MAARYNPPPNWPAPPPGWAPPAGWQPAPEWPPPPDGWQFWVDDVELGRSATREASEPPVGRAASSSSATIPLFGARGKARELAAEVDALRQQLDRLGALDIVTLERRREDLRRQVAEETSRLESERRGLQEQIDDLRRMVVVTQETAILQEVGIYEYRHPLSDSVAYKSELARLQDQIKSMARKDGGAIEADTSWTVNGSAAQGRRMAAEYSKLMLRAYNAEADNLVRAMKAYKLKTSIDRLNRVVETIERLGKTMSIRVAPSYHRLRIRELELTADYLEKRAGEKEREREERERLREERKVQQEIERERERLHKERTHYLNAIAVLEAKGDLDGAARLRQELADIEKAIEDVDYRAANVRAGYVYVISNIGAFGPETVKIGMTRRLEPMDRIRELGDASVPFRFDVHALFFSEDAVGIEARMHERLADRRVNRVNLRREFFRATPAEAKRHLLELAGDLLHFEEIPEAVEYHQSLNTTPDSSSVAS